MSDIPPQPYIFEGVDPVPESRRFAPWSAAEIYAALSRAGTKMTDAFDSAKKPGMPLSVLSNVAREAPLASLLAAFLVGVAVARRR
jgi:lambda repressor-like predicted transcriptional regulator